MPFDIQPGKKENAGLTDFVPQLHDRVAIADDYVSVQSAIIRLLGSHGYVWLENSSLGLLVRMRGFVRPHL
jgi:hypothetical protein